MSWTAETHGSGEPGSGKRQTQQPKPFDINPSNSGPKLIWTALIEYISVLEEIWSTDIVS